MDRAVHRVAAKIEKLFAETTDRVCDGYRLPRRGESHSILSENAKTPQRIPEKPSTPVFPPHKASLGSP